MKNIFFSFLMIFVFVLLAQGQKQLLLQKELIDSSLPKVLKADLGYYIAYHQREYYDGTNYNIVVYLTKFDECDNELWTSKLITPVDNFVINHMDYFTDSTILIALNKSDGALYLLEVNLEGESISSKLLEYEIHNCDRFHLNYIENNQNGEFYITGYTSCGTAVSSSYFIYGSKQGKSLNGKIFFEYSNDTHIKFLEEGGVLAQVGQHYFKMQSFDELDWQFKLDYQQDQNLFLSYQPLIQGNDVYLLVEKTYTSGFVLKFDLATQTPIWQSGLFEYNLPIRINVTGNNMLSITSRHQDENLVINMDKTTGKTSAAYLINQLGNRYRGSSIGLDKAVLYVYESAFGNTFNSAVLNILLNPQVDSCLIKQTIDLETNEELVSFEKQNFELFTDDFTAELIDTGKVMQIYLDTLLFAELCRSFTHVDIKLDSSINCDEMFVLEQFDEGYNFKWDDGSTDSHRQFLETNVYSVTISDCRSIYRLTLDLMVEECAHDIYIPNVISRNSINGNDKLSLSASGDFEYFELMIFDRWGGLVHTTNDPTLGWTPLDHINGIYVCKVTYQITGMNGVQTKHQSISILD